MSENTPGKLWNRNFVLLFQGQFVSAIGSQAYVVAMALWVKHATESATLMGTLSMVSLLPAALLAPLAGVVADQYSRRMIIILCDVAAGLAVTGLATLMFLAPERVSLIVALLFPLALLMGLVRAFFSPTMLAAIPDLVPRESMGAANSLFQSSGQFSLLLGQGLGGLLFVLWGAPVLFLINGVSYLLSALSESFAEIPQKLVARGAGWRSKVAELKADLASGFRYVWDDTGLRTLFLVTAVMNFFIAPILVLLPFFVEDTLGATAEWYGYTLAAFGGGALLGYAMAGFLKLAGRTKSTVLLVALILTAAGLAATSVAPTVGLAVVVMGITGLANGFFNVQVLSVMQVAIPSEIRGRVFGVLTALTSGLMPLSMGLSGLAADLLDQRIRLIYGACGVVIITSAIAVCFVRDFRDFLTLEGQPS